MIAVKDSENKKSASHPTRSEAMDRAVLCLYSNISSLSPSVEGPCACPPEGIFFLMVLLDSSFLSRSISAFCDLIVSFNSERTDDDSCFAIILLLLRSISMGLRMNATGSDLGRGLSSAVTAVTDDGIISSLRRIEE